MQELGGRRAKTPGKTILTNTYFSQADCAKREQKNAKHEDRQKCKETKGIEKTRQSETDNARKRDLSATRRELKKLKRGQGNNKLEAEIRNDGSRCKHRGRRELFGKGKKSEKLEAETMEGGSRCKRRNRTRNHGRKRRRAKLEAEIVDDGSGCKQARSEKTPQCSQDKTRP